MSHSILPEPTGELKQLSRALADRMRSEMAAEGLLPFIRFMEMALYEPALGYYSAGLHKLGASGDFTTAPELGDLFAGCLARQIAEVSEDLGAYDIVEVGAGTGQLAADVLLALPPDRLPDRYRILERSADLKAVQRETVASHAPELAARVSWIERPPEEPWRGVLLANEVLDALAVERFRIGTEGVEQLCVREDGERFGWAARPAPERLRREVEKVLSGIDGGLPAGYRSEINPQLESWLAAVTGQMSRGLALFVDYGYPRHEYYLPERNDGTLMCHYRHRAHGDVFFWPGLQDITAWVDFTALAEAADACGLEVEGFTGQAMFLLGCGLDRLLQQRMADSDDEGLGLSAQTRQLTMPGMMGERFKVMGLGRQLERPLTGFSLQDLRTRL